VELIELAQALGAPVTTSYGGKGAISDRHPLAMGCVRGGRVYGENPIWQVLEASDAVLVVGSRLAHTITSGAGMKLPEKMVHLDIDEAVFDKNFPVSVRLQGDAALGLSALTDALKELGKQPNADAVAIAAEGKAAQRTQLVESGPNQQRAFDVMREAMPDETIVTADAAIAAYWGVRGLEATGPRRFVNVHAWSSIGMAFPAALGAKAGNPDAPVVSIHGDGGFQFNMQELGTAAQYDLGIVQLVFNDDAWGALYDYQDKLQGGRHIGTELTNPDFMALAAAYGLKGVQVDSVDAFGEELRTATRSGEFTLLEVRTPNGFDNFT
jgi:acetolactate synthase-1/2/3 large subunit